MTGKIHFSTAIFILCVLILGACTPSNGTASSMPTAAAATSAIPAASTAGGEDWTTTWANFLSTLPADGFRIAPAALNNLIQGGSAPFIIDVREAGEVAQSGHIKGAVNIPLRSLLQNLDELPGLDAPIVVHCSIGHRGAMAMAALRLLGYTNVLSLDGDFAAWTVAGLPVVSDNTTATPVKGNAAVMDSTRLAALNNFLSTLPDSFDAISDTEVLKATSSATPPLVVDVRSQAEIASAGSINGSISTPINSMFLDTSDLPDDFAAPIVTVSSDGQDGAIAAMALHMIGFTNANSMTYGFNSWVNDKLPILK